MRPKLIIIAGPNGSGKTTFTPQMLEHDWADGCLFRRGVKEYADQISSVIRGGKCAKRLKGG